MYHFSRFIRMRCEETLGKMAFWEDLLHVSFYLNLIQSSKIGFQIASLSIKVHYLSLISKICEDKHI